MNFKNLKNSFNKELIEIEKNMKDHLKTEIEIIDDICTYIIFLTGKRIRPILTILFGKIFDTCKTKYLMMASIIELIHTATLLHDDVVDLSEKRRGKISVNKVWGNKEAILTGDFLYTKSFEMMTKINNIKIFKLMSYITNMMSKGEIIQLLHKKNFNISKVDYFNIIRCKTAFLFSASTLTSAILSDNINNKTLNAAFNYGLHLGITYQLVDDILDYCSDDNTFGKNTCDDLLNGTFTLPLICLITGSKKKREFIKNIITNSKNKNDLLEIRNLVINSNALDLTFNLAEKHACLAKKSISNLDNNQYIEKAICLIDFILNRKY